MSTLSSEAPPISRSTRRRGRPGARRRARLFLHEVRALLRLAGPVIFSQLGATGMNTMDTIMVGPLGPDALAAAGLSGALHMALLMVSTGTVLGMGPLVSQAFGAGDRERCRQVLVQGLWLSAALSVPMVAFNLVGEPMALLLGQDPGVAAVVGDYMHALAWGVPAVIVFMAFRQYLEGRGLTAPAMVITFLGLAVNYVGNRALIYGVEGWVPAMGVEGSGWATTLVRWAMLLAMLAYVLRHLAAERVPSGARLPDRATLRRIVGIGLPTGAQVGLEVGLFSLAAVMMGWFGAVELGTHQVTINIASTTFMVALGVSIAGSIRVGQQIGAGSAPGMRRAVAATYLLAVGFMALCALLFLLAPEALLRLYTDEPEILRLGRSLLLMAALFQVFDGAQVAGISVLRGAADTRVPMIHAGLAYWVVGLPAAYLLGFRTALGPVGVWAGLVASLAVAALLMGLRVRTVLFRPARPGRP